MAGVKMNRSEMRRMLRAEGAYSGVRDELTDRMTRTLSQARVSAPVASGAYRDSLRIVQDTTDRAAVRVVSDVDYAMVVEANTGNLSRALDAAGGE